MKSSLAQNQFFVKIFYKLFESSANLLQCMYRDASKGKVETGKNGFTQELPNTDACSAACMAGTWRRVLRYAERGYYDKRGTGGVHK